jgi:hypothetical protein
MKPAAPVFFTACVFITCFLIGGCGNGGDQPSMDTETENDEISGLPQLMIQSGDSLLFNQIQPAEDMLQLPDTLDKASILAYSFIAPSQSLSTIRAYQPGTILHFSLDENLLISARVNRNQSVGEQIRTLTGPLLDPYTGNIMLSVDSNSIYGTIELLTQNRLFYIRYDRINNLHFLAEIDRSTLDYQDGSEPLEYN